MKNLEYYYDSPGTQILTQAFGSHLEGLPASDIFLMLAGIAIAAAIAASDNESPSPVNITDQLTDLYPGIEGDGDVDYGLLDDALDHFDKELDPVRTANLLQGLAVAAFIQSQ